MTVILLERDDFKLSKTVFSLSVALFVLELSLGENVQLWGKDLYEDEIVEN